MGHNHAGFHCLLSNSDFFLRYFTLTELLPQQNSSHLKIRTSVRDISKPISYFKIHPLSGISKSRLMLSSYKHHYILWHPFLKLFFAREITTTACILKLRIIVHMAILYSARRSLMTKCNEQVSEESPMHRNVHGALTCRGMSIVRSYYPLY